MILDPDTIKARIDVLDKLVSEAMSQDPPATDMVVFTREPCKENARRSFLAHAVVCMVNARNMLNPILIEYGGCGTAVDYLSLAQAAFSRWQILYEFREDQDE